MFKRVFIVLVTALLAFSFQSASARPAGAGLRQVANKSRAKPKGKSSSRSNKPSKSRKSSSKPRRG
jgi:hypothetical protein